MRKLICLCMLLALTACKKEDNRVGRLTGRFCHSFILKYYQSDRYYFDWAYDGKYMRICLNYDKYESFTTPDICIGTVSEDERKGFERLAERNGDLSYDRVVYYLPGMQECYADNFREIRVVCTNRDVDAPHPAGSRIDDLLTAKIDTYGPYVRSGYKGEERRVVEKRIPDLLPEDLEMICLDCLRIRFTDPSSLYGSYHLKATLVTTEDREIIAEGLIGFD